MSVRPHLILSWEVRECRKVTAVHLLPSHTVAQLRPTQLNKPFHFALFLKSEAGCGSSYKKRSTSFLTLLTDTYIDACTCGGYLHMGV